MIIKCCESEAELEFSEREGLAKPDGQEYFRITIRSNRLFSFTDVYAFDPSESDLVRLFEDLAENWKGFDGEKKWSSLEDEFSLSCSADNLGHFALEVILRDFDDDSFVRKTIYVESGQLKKIAQEARDFFNISQN